MFFGLDGAGLMIKISLNDIGEPSRFHLEFGDDLSIKVPSDMYIGFMELLEANGWLWVGELKPTAIKMPWKNDNGYINLKGNNGHFAWASTCLYHLTEAELVESIKPTMVSNTSSIYCNCISPKLKRVYISSSIGYSFCEVCKREKL